MFGPSVWSDHVASAALRRDQRNLAGLAIVTRSEVRAKVNSWSPGMIVARSA